MYFAIYQQQQQIICLFVLGENNQKKNQLQLFNPSETTETRPTQNIDHRLAMFHFKL